MFWMYCCLWLSGTIELQYRGIARKGQRTLVQNLAFILLTLTFPINTLLSLSSKFIDLQKLQSLSMLS